MRLDRFICNATGQSRSQVQSRIRAGAVQVDGLPTRSAKQAIGADSRVVLDGQAIVAPQPLYIMLNKPAGFVCASEDGLNPTVLDLVRSEEHARLGREPLQVVGRLDKDTTGLLFLTTDGHWNHRVTAPNRRCNKLYRAVLAEPLLPDAVARLQHGILLRNEDRPTRPCTVNLLDSTCVTISISEGRYHQVKRMFAAVGNRVVELHRLQVGAVCLDAGLAPGHYRPLTAQEIQAF